MNAQQLKNSILQMAIQGKLVPQDPNDEPASVLLERIRAEKEKLIKEGNIKKEKNSSYIFRGEDNLLYEKVGKNEPVCIADKVPFEIPDSWAWCRLTDVITLYNGRAYKQSELLNKGKYPVLRVGNLFTNNSWYYSDLVLEENKYISAGDLIYAWSASFGPFIWNGERSIFHYHIWKMDYSLLLFRDYLYYFLMAETETIKAGGHGLSMQHVTKEGMEELLIPIPPYNEQKRIVRKIVSLIPHIDQFKTVQESCEKLDKELPDRLKKAILQQAVMGKLVPQDPNDEPASVLLERVRNEKENLIKDGKIKKEKDSSYIFRGEDNLPYEMIGKNEPVCIADEVPFEIPDSWEWCRLTDVMILYNGRAYKQAELLDKGKYPVLRVGNLFTNNSWYYSDLELEENKYVSDGDLLYAWSASFGPFIWNGEKCIFHYHIWKIEYSSLLFRDYIYYFLMAETESIKADGHGLSMQHVTKEGMEKLLIPIPPFKEQKRIVDKIEELLHYCELLRENKTKLLRCQNSHDIIDRSQYTYVRGNK